MDALSATVAFGHALFQAVYGAEKVALAIHQLEMIVNAKSENTNNGTNEERESDETVHGSS